MLGDVVLCHGTHALNEWLIATVTKGPYVHCGVAVGPTTLLAANIHGIGREETVEDRKYTIIHLLEYVGPEAIRQGLAWAEKQIGKEYGWFDIVYQAVKYMNPNNRFRFGEQDFWDCSDFVARYLLHCGIALPDGWDDPYTLTPNDIGRLFNLVALRTTGETAQLVKKR